MAIEFEKPPDLDDVEALCRYVLAILDAAKRADTPELRARYADGLLGTAPCDWYWTPEHGLFVTPKR